MKRDAFNHAMAEFPRESCGLVVMASRGPTYHPCENLSNAASCFLMDPKDYARAAEMGEIVAVVHSHPNLSPTPSLIDRQACAASGLPWSIVSVPDGSWAYCEPQGYTPDLIGRQWVHAESDCYTLVRDWYRINGSIYLNDYDRNVEWWKHGDDLYCDHFRDEGFREIKLSEVKPGDALLMKVGSKVVNHAAIYLGDNVILHHVQNRLSGREMLDDQWMRRITHALRYADDSSAG
jgi:proteasome lid subunit RPN8/RPN11